MIHRHDDTLAGGDAANLYADKELDYLAGGVGNELFNHLQVWNDFNQDAKVQEGELRSLKDAGVTSIDLNYVSTNIEINGNNIWIESKNTRSAA